MIPRRAQSLVEELRRGYPVVAITGPRQSGKTTLAQLACADLPYVSLEDPIEASYFREDPVGFLNRFADGAVFDEAQRAPSLFPHLQGRVDGDRRLGRYILTGSQQFDLFAGITQSRAGRVGRVELLPFDRGELDAVDAAELSLDAAILRGAYPPVYDRPVAAHRWYADYFATYVQRDVRQVLGVREKTIYSRLYDAYRKLLRELDGQIELELITHWQTMANRD